MPMVSSFACRSCGSTHVGLVVDLGEVPPSDTFPLVSDPGPEARLPLELYLCSECSLLQLGPEAVLAPEQPSAVDSNTARSHAAWSVSEILRHERVEPGDTVIELDSGHGASWLPGFEAAGLRPQPKTGTADLVVDVHWLMHETQLDPVLAQHASRLAKAGVLVCEFFHARPMVSHTLIDTIRHGHYIYLSLTAAIPAFARHGLTITRAVEVPAYGGSLRVSARRTAGVTKIDGSVSDVLAAEARDGINDRETLLEFGRRGRDAAASFRRRLEEFAAAGLFVGGYGAPSKAPVLLALAGVDSGLLPYTVDLSPAKAGRRIPGAGVPIRPTTDLLVNSPDVVAVLTWDIADEIAAQLHDLAAPTAWRPMLYIPLPVPREFPLIKV